MSKRSLLTATAIVALAAQPAPADFVDVAVVPWPRNERGALSGLKTTSYGENVRALAYAAEHGGSEADERHDRHPHPRPVFNLERIARANHKV